MATENEKMVPSIDSSLRHILRMPAECYGCSGIVINGRRIKSLVFTTDLAIISITPASTAKSENPIPWMRNLTIFTRASGM